MSVNFKLCNKLVNHNGCVVRFTIKRLKITFLAFLLLCNDWASCLRICLSLSVGSLKFVLASLVSEMTRCVSYCLVLAKGW